MIFIDRCIPRSVARALASVRNDVEWLDDRFPPGTRDEVWLAEAGQRGWIVVTRDKKIRTRPNERRAIEDNQAGCFVLASAGNLNRWETLKIVVPTLDEMERLFAATPRPFIFTINSQLRFREVDLGVARGSRAEE